MATKCGVPFVAMKQGAVESRGTTPNAKAVVSVMPMVSAKASARIAAIFFMASVPFPAMVRLPGQAKDICDRQHLLVLFGSDEGHCCLAWIGGQGTEP